PGSATQLVFTLQPTTATAGGTIKPAVRVTARDALGNTATGFVGNVTVAIGTNPAGGTLGGTRTFAAIAGVATFPSLSINRAVNGVATFSNLTIDKGDSWYTVTASATGLTSTNAAFRVFAGTATELVFRVQPSTATAGARITPQVEVIARDALGNTATGFRGD